MNLRTGQTVGILPDKIIGVFSCWLADGRASVRVGKTYRQVSRAMLTTAVWREKWERERAAK